MLVLDMGEPVRIAEVASRLIEQADRHIDIVYTGLRDGEKMHEVLLGQDERDHRPTHHLISQVPVPPLHADRLEEIHLNHDVAHVTSQLRRVCRLVSQRPFPRRPRRSDQVEARSYLP